MLYEFICGFVKNMGLHKKTDHESGYFEGSDLESQSDKNALSLDSCHNKEMTTKSHQMGPTNGHHHPKRGQKRCRDSSTDYPTPKKQQRFSDNFVTKYTNGHQQHPINKLNYISDESSSVLEIRESDHTDSVLESAGPNGRIDNDVVNCQSVQKDDSVVCLGPVERATTNHEDELEEISRINTHGMF